MVLNYKENNFLQNINLNFLVAKHAATLLWGEGYVVSSKDKKFEEWLNGLLNENGFQFLVEDMEQLLSQYGRVIMTIDKTIGGKIKLSLADPYFTNKVGRIYLKENIAVIWKRFYLDDKMMYLRQVFDEEKVVSTWYNAPVSNDNSKNSNEGLPQENSRVKDQMVVWGQYQRINKNDSIKPVWKHNLGICPLIEFMNLPQQSYQEYYIGYNPDNYAIGNTFQNTVNNLICEYNKAIIRNKSKIFGKFTQEMMENYQKQVGKDKYNFAYDDFFVNGSVLNANGESVYEVIQPKLQFEDYINSIFRNIELHFNGCGYSFDSITKKSDLTATSATLTREKDLATTKRKRNWRQFQLLNLFDKIAIASKQQYLDKKGVRKYTFTINTNIIINSLVEAQTEELKLRNGLTSLTYSIALLHKISLGEAEILKNKIIKERKELQKLGIFGENKINDNSNDPIQEKGENTNSLGNKEK